MVWEGGKAAAGGYTGEVINESHLVPPILELVWMPDDLMNEMPLWWFVQGWTYDCFLPYALMRWCSRFVLCHVVSRLGVCLLPSDWWFLGGFALSCLSTTKVLSSCQHSWQLLGPHVKPLTCLLGRPLIEILSQHLQPNCHCQYAGGAIPWFMGQAGCIGDG